MAWVGSIAEFILNLVALNGGILRLIWHIITASVVIPKRDDANYRSFIGHIDGRLELYKSNSLIHYFPLMDTPENIGIGDINILDLSMMAAKVAYENAAYVENAVTNHWKMHFVGFFDCWNRKNLAIELTKEYRNLTEFLEKNATQAFIFCNKAEDADLIVLAFRGTEPFNASDWSTDVDLSWLFTGKMGNIHLGFLKALGLQDEKNFLQGFPRDYNGTPDKPLAYYALREALSSLIQQHKNAKIVVTGHSLGGALAAIFPALLSFHDEHDILSSMYGVMTYGQPRVGDAVFGTYIETIVRLKHYRMMYRYDIVPRIPFDVPPVALFKHFGTCIYYNGWYNGQVVTEAPNPNYFDPMYVIPMYWSAWSDLLKALFLGATQGQDFKESFTSILYRLSGLIIPGVAFHSPRDYVNGGRLAKIANS
ncbi:Lipase [Cocos nucifera]|uniref:Lipase n=1 Tax=Cocos nucifera TaxID=13894 RepID=A0A8K0I2C7_COCNU|nr:Lipase [Cocos nucifera]